MAISRSPFDPYLVAFLTYLQRHPNGFSPTSARSIAKAAEAIDLPPALVEALFTSAGSRGLVRPARASRGRSRWELSRKGEVSMSTYTLPDDDSA